MDVEADLWDSGLLGLCTKHVECAVLSPYALGSPDMISHEITSGCNMDGHLLERAGHVAKKAGRQKQQSVIECSKNNQ